MSLDDVSQLAQSDCMHGCINLNKLDFKNFKWSRHDYGSANAPVNAMPHYPYMGPIGEDSRDLYNRPSPRGGALSHPQIKHFTSKLQVRQHGKT